MFAPVISSQLGGAAINRRLRLGQRRQSSAFTAQPRLKTVSHRNAPPCLQLLGPVQLVRQESAPTALVALAHHHCAASPAAVLPNQFVRVQTVNFTVRT